MSKRDPMSTDTTGWPLLDEGPRTVPPVRRLARRARGRPAWALAVLAFVCGAAISAAGFAIGWKHLAQSGTAAQTKLAAATAHVQRLDASLAAARRRESRLDRRLTTAAQSTRRLAVAVARLKTQASATEHAAGPVSGDAGTIAATAARVTSELKTLSDYLTTTPAGQVDGGYVATQIAYLSRQLTALQASGGALGTAASEFRSSAHKLAAEAASLSTRR